MGSRSTLCVLAALFVLAVLVAGCGASGAPSIPGVSGGSAPAVAAAADNSGLHGPPADWQGHPPIHVHRSAATAPVGYSPTRIRHAYGFDQITGNGSGQTLAIVDAYGSPTIQKDLNTFCSTFGLATTTIQIAYPSGKPKKTDGGWALETALDVEWAHAIAPGATILLVVAKSASFTDLLAAVDYAAARAAQVSMSWGGNEFAGEAAYDTHFNKAGITFTASSGDSGGGAGWPAVSTYVTAVGGTTLNLDAAGNVLSETAWSGSNGGPSAYLAEPSYQTQWQSSGKREMPDVSYLGNPATGVPVYSSTRYQGTAGWFQVGGTSAGSPMWAALFALANASRTTPLSSPNVAVYGIGTPSAFTTYYRDITQGSNTGYSAVTGYDLVTGLGTPKAATLVPALVSR